MSSQKKAGITESDHRNVCTATVEAKTLQRLLLLTHTAIKLQKVTVKVNEEPVNNVLINLLLR